MSTLAEATTWQWWHPSGPEADRPAENDWLRVRLVADPDWEAVAICCPDAWALWVDEEFIDAGRIPTVGEHWYHDVVELPSPELPSPELPSPEPHSPEPPGATEHAANRQLRLTLLNAAARTSRCDPHPWRVALAARVGQQWRAISPDRIQVGPDPQYVSGSSVEWVSPQLGHSFRCDLRDDDEVLGKAVPAPAPVAAPRARPRPVGLGRVVGRFTVVGDVTAVPDAPTPALQMQGASLRTRSITPTEELVAAVDPDGCGAVAIADLGEVVAGHVELELECDAPVRVDLGWGEHLDDLRVRTAVGPRNFAARIEFPAGRTRFTHRLQRIAGRHLQLHLTTEADHVRIRHLVLHRRGHRLPDTRIGHTDPRLHAIGQACDRTLRLCAQEHYEDTPWREQSLYGLDARVQTAIGLAAYGPTATDQASAAVELSRFSQELLGANRRPDGLLRMTSPSAVDRTIPSFALHWICSVHELCSAAPDLDHLARCWPSVESVLEAFSSSRVDGLPLVRPAEDLWHFYDWTPTLDGRLEICEAGRWDAPLAVLFATAAEYAGGFADALGRGDGDRWRALAAEVDAAAVAMFAADGVPVSYACPCHGRAYPGAPEQQDSFTVALAALAPGQPWRDRAAGLRAWLADPTNDPGTLVQSYFRYRALLADPGHTDLVRAEVLQRWAPQTAPGATTWEVSEGAVAFDRAGSLSHAWAAAPLAFLPLL